MDFALSVSRLCAHVLNLVIRELGLSGMGVVFSGEYAEDWVILSSEVRALLDGRHVATVYLDDVEKPKRIRVVVPDHWDLIRANRMDEYEPEQYGLVRNESRNWLGERSPDLDVDVDLREVELPYMGGMRRALSRHTVTRQVRVKGSL